MIKKELYFIKPTFYTLQDGGKQLQEGMEENSSITHMDLRLTDCGQESEYCINQILSTNREKQREMRLNTGVDPKTL